MNQIAQTNSLQKGSTIYVEGMPATIKTAQFTIETLCDKWLERYGIYEPNGSYLLTGTLEVAIALDFCSPISRKMGNFVTVRLGHAEAQFWVDSLETGMSNPTYGTLFLSASQTKCVPTAPKENEPLALNASPLALPPA